MTDLTKKEFQSILKTELSLIQENLNDRPTRKELQSILKAELKDRPTTPEVYSIVNKALINHPTHDDVKTIIRNDLKQFATKDDLKQFATKDDLKQLGFEIVDAIERGMGVKADKTEVSSLTQRVDKLEKIAAVN